MSTRQVFAQFKQRMITSIKTTVTKTTTDGRRGDRGTRLRGGREGGDWRREPGSQLVVGVVGSQS